MPRLIPDQRLVCEGRKGREGQRAKDGDESLCFRKKGKERMVRKEREGQRGKDNEERKARK